MYFCRAGADGREVEPSPLGIGDTGAKPLVPPWPLPPLRVCFTTASAIGVERQVDSTLDDTAEGLLWLFSGILMATLMAFIQSIRRPVLGALTVSSWAWTLSFPFGSALVGLDLRQRRRGWCPAAIWGCGIAAEQANSRASRTRSGLSPISTSPYEGLFCCFWSCAPLVAVAEEYRPSRALRRRNDHRRQKGGTVLKCDCSPVKRRPRYDGRAQLDREMRGRGYNERGSVGHVSCPAQGSLDRRLKCIPAQMDVGRTSGTTSRGGGRAQTHGTGAIRTAAGLRRAAKRERGGGINQDAARSMSDDCGHMQTVRAAGAVRRWSGASAGRVVGHFPGREGLSAPPVCAPRDRSRLPGRAWDWTAGAWWKAGSYTGIAPVRACGLCLQRT
ncbi:hypothetical protein FKP32DRAFT_1284990 [Trametes sanguinea]|nr:hypothetical protein FKP32DRAFT_1284990 [Trametes sanguinea]